MNTENTLKKDVYVYNKDVNLTHVNNILTQVLLCYH